MYRITIRPEEVDSYSPANHTGTSNRRVISSKTVGAHHVEVLIGTITTGQGAHAHSHPTLEQASLILQGEGVADLNGTEVTVKAGDWLFNPVNCFHRFVTKSAQPVKVLVVYAPPYAENPKATLVYDERSRQAGEIVGGGSILLRPRPDLEFTPKGHDAGTVCHPIVNKKLAGSLYLDIFMQMTRSGSNAMVHAATGTERVFLLEQGRMTGDIDGTSFDVGAGDWLFVRDGASLTYHTTGDLPFKALVIEAST